MHLQVSQLVKALLYSKFLPESQRKIHISLIFERYFQTEFHYDSVDNERIETMSKYITHTLFPGIAIRDRNIFGHGIMPVSEQIGRYFQSCYFGLYSLYCDAFLQSTNID